MVRRIKTLAKQTVPKWKAWGNKEINQMKKEGSIQSMMRMPKKAHY